MKSTRLPLFLAGLCALVSPSVSPAQTTLAAGDIAFTMFNNSTSSATNKSRFSFVTLVNLSVGTTISFTDIGWTGSAFQAAIGASFNETSITYTVTSAVSRGTQISLGFQSGSLVTTATNGTVGYTSSSQSNINYSSSGDTILAYQGSFGASASFIAGLNYDTANVSTATGWSTAFASLSESVLPGSLTIGVSAVSLSVTGAPGSYSAASPETVNAQLNFAALSPSTPRTVSEWQSILNDPDNWNKATSLNAAFADSTQTLAISVIPEPSTWTVVLGSAVLGAVLLRRRKIK